MGEWENLISKKIIGHLVNMSEHIPLPRNLILVYLMGVSGHYNQIAPYPIQMENQKAINEPPQ